MTNNSPDEFLVVSTTAHQFVNSKTLVAKIDENIIETMENIGVYWYDGDHRSFILEYVQDVMRGLQEQNKIYNFKVISDDRNNPTESIDKGICCIDIEFKQVNCINTTKLHYEFCYDSMFLNFIYNVG